jgi:hypothetical protein
MKRPLLPVAFVAGCLLASCTTYPATPEGDARRAADASTIQKAGDSLVAASTFLPPPFNLIAAALVGIGTTIAVQKVGGKKSDPTKTTTT